MKEDVMGGACSTGGSGEECIWNVGRKAWRGDRLLRLFV